MKTTSKNQRISLTTPIVRGIEPPATGRTYVYDAKSPGLVVCVTPKGTRSFILYRRVNGRPSRILLGHFPMMTLEQAREKAVATSANINNGDDPNAMKRASRNVLTLGDVFTHFLENRTKAHGKETTAASHKSRFGTCLADWKDRRLTDIRRDEVIARHVKVGKERGHVTANRAIQLLRALLQLCGEVSAHRDGEPGGRYRTVPERTRANATCLRTNCRNSSRP